jgi:Staphylococcal nuclease homologue
MLSNRLARLEIPRIGDSEDAYGRTLAYIWLDTNRDGRFEHLYNEDLIALGLARTTTFSHTYSREFERLREAAEARGAGLWGASPAEPLGGTGPHGSGSLLPGYTHCGLLVCPGQDSQCNSPQELTSTRSEGQMILDWHRSC